MKNPQDRNRYLNKRYAEDVEFRERRKQCSRDFRAHKYATDPEWRAKESARCTKASRNTRLKEQHGITLAQLEAQLAAQHGACGCCKQRLGRIIRIDHKADGTVGLLCSRCRKLVASLRHIREHATAFEAFFKKHGLTRQLALHHELMQIWGMKPAQNESGSN